MSSLLPATTALAQLVNRYRVCWEVWPEYALIGQKSRQVGFELELLGSNQDLSEFAPASRKAVESMLRSRQSPTGLLSGTSR
jgi:hypothetical protein